jgi:DNA-binding transcriptional LysR family regulator
LLDDLRAGRLDAALVSLPAPTDGFRITDAGAEATVAAVSALPVAVRSRAPVGLRDIAERPILTFPRARNPAFYDSIVAAFHAVGEAPTIDELDLASVERLLLEVAVGSGTAIVGASVPERITTPGVTYIALDDSGPRLPSAVVTRDETPSPILLEFLRSFAGMSRPGRHSLRPVLSAA